MADLLTPATRGAISNTLAVLVAPINTLNDHGRSRDSVVVLSVVKLLQVLHINILLISSCQDVHSTHRFSLQQTLAGLRCHSASSGGRVLSREIQRLVVRRWVQQAIVLMKRLWNRC